MQREAHQMKLEATRLNNCWAVRPEGVLGTCGWIDDKPWIVVYSTARSAQRAIQLNGHKVFNEPKKEV